MAARRDSPGDSPAAGRPVAGGRSIHRPVAVAGRRPESAGGHGRRPIRSARLAGRGRQHPGGI